MIACSRGSLVAVIVDVGLPDQRGDDLVVEVRAKHPELPILIATAYDLGGMCERFEGDPGVAFRTKPFGFADVGSLLETLGVSLPASKL